MTNQAIPAALLSGVTGASIQVDGQWWFVLDGQVCGSGIIIEYGDSGGTVEGRRSYNADQLVNVLCYGRLGEEHDDERCRNPYNRIKNGQVSKG